MGQDSNFSSSSSWSSSESHSVNWSLRYLPACRRAHYLSISRQFSSPFAGRRSIQSVHGYCTEHFRRCNHTLSSTREILASMDVSARPLYTNAFRHGVYRVTVRPLLVFACQRWHAKLAASLFGVRVTNFLCLIHRVVRHARIGRANLFLRLEGIWTILPIRKRVVTVSIRCVPVFISPAYPIEIQWCRSVMSSSLLSISDIRIVGGTHSSFSLSSVSHVHHLLNSLFTEFLQFLIFSQQLVSDVYWNPNLIILTTFRVVASRFLRFAKR